MKRQSLKMLLKLVRKSLEHELNKEPQVRPWITRSDLIEMARDNLQAAVNYERAKHEDRL